MAKDFRKNWKNQAGYITACSFCGEMVGNATKYCPTYKLKANREEVRANNIRAWVKQGMELDRAERLMPERGFESNIS